MIQSLKERDFKNIHQLMLDEGFPKVSNDFELCRGYFQNCKHYGIYENGRLVLWFGFQVRGTAVYFDIACRRDWRSRWATKAVLKEIVSLAFSYRNKEVFSYLSTSASFKSGTRVGFEAMDGDNPSLYKLTKETIANYLRIK